MRARELVLRPPRLPGGFWDASPVRNALAAWHMGRVIAAYRNHPAHGRPISQGIVAGWIGVTQAHLSRIENGPPTKDLDKLIYWATIFDIPEGLLWFKLPRRTGTAEPLGEPRAFSASAPDADPLRFRAEPGLVGRSHAAVMNGFRVVDQQVGGGHLYTTLVTYLRAELAPRLFGGDHDADTGEVFSAAAALTEMAGWMAHDGGRDVAAERHFARALNLAGSCNDHLIHAHILASMSHLERHLGRPVHAIRLAQRGRAILARRPPQPEVEGRLIAMEARGLAALQQAAECRQHLTRAEFVLTQPAAEPLSAWVSRFDESAFASETAWCLRQLGELAGVQRQANRILALRSGHRIRSRAFAQLHIATALLAQGELEQVCSIGHEVLDGTQQLGSYPVLQQLLELRDVLVPHRASRAVREFLDCLDEALPGRLRWCRQSTAPSNDPPGRSESMNEL